MTEQQHLKPCPFCGGEAEIVHDSYICCSKCPCTFPDEEMLNDLIIKWNRRKKIMDPIDKLQESINKLSEQIDQYIKDQHNG